jgi:hypothetical protein
MLHGINDHTHGLFGCSVLAKDGTVLHNLPMNDCGILWLKKEVECCSKSTLFEIMTLLPPSLASPLFQQPLKSG